MRAPTSRQAICAAAAAARFAVCDVNLRPPYTDASVVAAAVRNSDLLKLNDDELLPVTASILEDSGLTSEERADAQRAYEAARLADQIRTFKICNQKPNDAARAIARAAALLGKAVDVSTIVVTRGSLGAVLWESSDPCDAGSLEFEGGTAWACNGFLAPVVADTVGAGDAFLAAFLASRLRDPENVAASLESGCRLGAFVAGCTGATPEHCAAKIRSLDPRDRGDGDVVFRLI